MIQLSNISKTYMAVEGAGVHALRRVSLSIEPGDYVAIVGPSGSGKSTLLNIIGLLDSPTSGSYTLEGNETGDLDTDSLAALRSKTIGFVFQSFHLLPDNTALENVELPLLYSGRDQVKGLALAALSSVGLAERLRHRPPELSGGQQQRVAIARALVNDPDVIVADEPTGNLDGQSGREVLDIFQDLNNRGKTILLVTHDKDVANRAQRIVSMVDGSVVSDKRISPMLSAGSHAAAM